MKRSFIFLKDFDITISKMNKVAILQAVVWRRDDRDR